MADRDLADTIQATATALADRTVDFEQRPAATIEPRRAALGSVERRLMDAFATATGSGELELGPTLGEGGMGIVQLATQVRLGRKVAVKTLRDGDADEAAVLKLLREAWATGSLEHPNVVPVHDIGWSRTQRPLIVLKHIEGVDWAALIASEEEVRRRYGRPLLDWNLSVLLQVCQAVSFAHSRGILHRDLKPENVMIGAFGEVYVLDWGIAVAKDDSDAQLLPRVAQATELAGTPSYMAPEMLGRDPPQLSERTDVYLLGAIVCEILSGAPPHGGRRFGEILTSIVRSTPQLPADAPAELADICRRAMQADPQARFSSVVELRAAIEAFIEHRTSHQLALATQARLERMVAARAAAAVDPSARRALYGEFETCRFGFQQALAAWGDNASAKAGLAEALSIMVRHELEHADVRAAERLFQEIERPAPELREALEGARRAQQREDERIRLLESRFDQALGRRGRTIGMALLGIVFVVTPLAFGRGAVRPIGYGRLTAALVFLFVATALVGVAYRGLLARSLFARQGFYSILGVIGVMLPLVAASRLLGLTSTSAEVFLLGLCAVGGSQVAAFQERRAWLSTSGYTTAMLVAAWRPELRYLAIAAANVVMTLTMITAWRERRR